jgi:4-hydroxy-2-oxoglutarate aldolase
LRNNRFGGLLTAHYNPSTLNNSQLSHLSKDDLRGVMLPITTPFTEDGELQLDALKFNIGKWNETPITGYVMLGSTGERAHLDEREYLQVITAAREEVPAHLRFIVGAGQQSTRGTVEEIRRVNAIGGVDAVLVITPSFYRTSVNQTTLAAYYQAVADASPVPVILYSMPALTGMKIEAGTVATLSEHENIIGLKDSSPDVEGLQQTLREVGEDFAVLTGNGTVLEAALQAGACGGILAVGCVAASLCVAILEAVQAEDFERATRLQTSLTPLAAAVTTRFGLGGLKTALDMVGWEGGFVRAPLRMPDALARDEIRRCLEEAQTNNPPTDTKTHEAVLS